MRSLENPVARLAVAAFGCLLALTPLVASAQEAMDPAVRATAETAAAVVGRVARPATIAVAGPAIADLPRLLPTPTPAPGPTPTPQADGPSFDVTSAVAYETDGLTLNVPSGWDVESDPGFGMLFNVRIPDTDIELSVQDGGTDAPGIAALVMFRTLGEALPASLMEGATLEYADTVLTDQGLPLTRIRYQGNNTDQDIGGAFDILCAGTKIYLVWAAAPIDQWPEFSDVVDWMESSLVVEEAQVDLLTAEGDDFFFVDEDGAVEVWVPDGWRVSDLNAAGMPVAVANPDYSVALMLTSEAQLEEEGGEDLLRFITYLTAGMTEEAVDGLAHIVLAAAVPDYEDARLDADTLTNSPRDGGVMVSVAGELVLSAGAEVPIILYLDIGDGRLAAAVAVGDMNELLADEATVLEIVQSIAPLE
jgi:hypothetical protein